ncbi:lonely Cys domain-containing protein [Streptomyces sp. SID11233]|nr:lonely Cys domain-containing protein [Streptomyces sp. SID11233]
MYQATTNRLFLDGRWRDAEDTAAWIRRWTAWDDDEPLPLVFVAGQAGHVGPRPGQPSFADEVAKLLDAPWTIATAAHPVQLSPETIVAGMPVSDGAGGIDLHTSDAAGWELHRPGTENIPLGPDLSDALAGALPHLPPELAAHGAELTPARSETGAPLVWSFGPEARPGIAAYTALAGSQSATTPATAPTIARPPVGEHPDVTSPDARPATGPSSTPSPPAFPPTGGEDSSITISHPPLHAPHERSESVTSAPTVQPTRASAEPPPEARRTRGIAPGSLPPAVSTVVFEAGAGELGTAQRAAVAELAHQVAEAGLRNAQGELPFPRITITGYEGGGADTGGDRAGLGAATGQQRAEAVAAVFRQELDNGLKAIQRQWRGYDSDTSDGDLVLDDEPDVEAADFTIKVVSPNPAAGVGGPSRTDSREPRQQTVITIDYPPHAEGLAWLEHLYKLSQRDEAPAEAEPFDPDPLVTLVLHLRTGAPVTGRDRSRAYALVKRAKRAGRATSLAALGAFHLMEHGLLADATLVTSGNGRPLARNWSGEEIPNLETASYDVVSKANGSAAGNSSKSVPSLWQQTSGDPRPFIVTGVAGNTSEIDVDWGDGTNRAVPYDQVAELLAFDEALAGLDKEVPVVLAVPYAADGERDLPQTIADRIGRKVWAHSGAVRLEHEPDTERTRLTVTDGRRGEKIPLGAWIASRPGDAAHPGGARWRTDAPRWYREVRSVTLARYGVPYGRAAFDDGDLIAREDTFDRLGGYAEYSDYDRVTNDLLDGSTALPWAGMDPYFFNAHGRPGTIDISMLSGEFERKSGNEVGRYLKRRRSVERLALGRPIVLLVCWANTLPGIGDPISVTSEQPFVPDPLMVVSTAQQIANQTGRTVFALDRPFASGPQYTRSLALTSAGLQRGTWAASRPEPMDRLDEFARVANVRTAQPATAPSLNEPGLTARQATTLRLTRALRRTFGDEVADDSYDPSGTYQSLLRGIGALENMRQNDSGLRGEGEFTLDLLDRVTRSYMLKSGAGMPLPDQLPHQAIREMLAAAEAHLSATPHASLRTFVPLPSVEAALKLLRVPGRNVRDAKLLREKPTVSVTAYMRQRLLWATVKVIERLGAESRADVEALARKVVHLRPGHGAVTQADRNHLLWTAVSAVAAGRDVRNNTELAAFHVELQGALADGTLVRSPSGKALGRNWTGRPIQGPVYLNSYRTPPLSADGTGPYTDVLAPWSAEGGAKGADPNAYFVLAEGDHGEIEMPWSDGSRRRIPADETAELLRRDEELERKPPGRVGVVVVGVSDDDHALGKSVASRKGASRYTMSIEKSLQLTYLPQHSGNWLVMSAPPRSQWKVDEVKVQRQLQGRAPSGGPSTGAHPISVDMAPRDLSAGHQLLDAPTGEAQHTGPGPGQYIELDEFTLPPSAPEPSGTAGTGAGPQPSPAAAATSEVRFTRPDGTEVLRAEQTVVPGVEIRRWDFDVSAGDRRLLRVERRVSLADGTLVAIREDEPNEPVTHFDADDSPIEHGRPVRVGETGINIPTATGFQVYDVATGALSHTGLRLIGPRGRPLPGYVMTPSSGGARSLVGDDGATVLGSVTAPPDAPGVFHVVPADTGPAIKVFDAEGRFSHHALALTGIGELGVPGGFIREPDADGLPRLVDAEGVEVPGSLVVPQLHDEYRIEYPGGHFRVDADAARVHDVVALTVDGDRTGLYVYTPVGAAAPLPEPRGEDGGAAPDAGTVSQVDGTLHVTALGHEVNVHTPQGAFSHTALPIVGGGVPGGYIRLSGAGDGPQLARGNGAVEQNTSVHPQADGGYLVEHPGGRIIVDDEGRHTHDVVEVTTDGAPSGRFVRTRVGASGTPSPHPSDRGGVLDTDTSVIRDGDELRLTERSSGSFTAHGLDGTHRYDAIRVRGGAFDGRFVRSDARGATLLDAELVAVPWAQAVPQTALPGGGFRVSHGDAHVVVDARGVPGFDVVGLRDSAGDQTDHFVFFRTPAAGASGAPPAGPLPVVRGPDGAELAVNVGVRQGGGLQTVDMTTIRAFAADGTFEFQARRLTDAGGTHLPENIRVFPGGAQHLVDGALKRLPATVRTRVDVTGDHDAGFNVRSDNGNFRVFDTDGRLELHAVAQQMPSQEGRTTPFRVTDGAGNDRFSVIPLGDVQINDPAQARFLDITAGHLRVLDGNLNELPDITAHAEPGGGYRIAGAQAGEFRRYDAGGRLEFQRVNIVRGSEVDPNRYFEVAYPAGGLPTWSLATVDANGAPLPGSSTRGWFEGGTVDMRGAGAGRVHLVSHTGTTVFERRLLPEGGILDAHHSTGSLGTFSPVNQRGTWAEIDVNGRIVRFGSRQWSESTRSYFDITKWTDWNNEVRHYHLSVDGGHVLANLRVNDPSWVRYDADFQPIAKGNRYTEGFGYIDRMRHPETGRPVTAQQKHGRISFNLHDVRRYEQLEIGADGNPARDYVSQHPDGNVNGFGKTLSNGDYLDVKRFAEQRPPVSFRNLSTEIRGTVLSRHPWLAHDNRLRVATWRLESGSGQLKNSGTQFTSNNKTVFYVAKDGELVRETRPLPGGETLEVGDVPLPSPTKGPPVTLEAGYLPWSEADLRGHRTSVRSDFTEVPDVGRRVIAWQDRHTPDLDDGNWYSPDATKRWNVVRTGFTDGTYLAHRPRPGTDAPTTPGNSDWTLYDHHGMVISRSDSFPHPAGGGRRAQIVGAPGSGSHTTTWHDAADPAVTGVRKIAYERQISTWGWDLESFQDFARADGNPDAEQGVFQGRGGDNSERLIRDHRLLGGGASIDAWSVVGPEGTEVWHWNKIDRHGDIMEFGSGENDRVRHWYDAEGTLLDRWAPGARWVDRVTGLGDRVIQEIPVARSVSAFQDFLADAPFRVRDYSPTPDRTFDGNVWEESDQGMIVREKKALPDGTFLETDFFNKQARRYATDGIRLLNDRSIAGYITEFDADGTARFVGRETHFVGIDNEYRGLNRLYRETNRWEFGASVLGESVYTPYAIKAIESVGIDVTQEWILDFIAGVAALAIARHVSGTTLSGMDVARAAFGATLSSMSKGVVAASHMAANRGGWKVRWSNIDYGKPPSWRPNDDSWNTEWGANERPTRWRGGTYEFGLGLLTGGVTSFVSGAAQSAIFGARATDGSLIRLADEQAALFGLVSTVGGLLDAASVGALRTAIVGMIGSRVIHRQGAVDIYGVGALGKLADKLFTLLFMSPRAIIWLGAQPDAPTRGHDG